MKKSYIAFTVLTLLLLTAIPAYAGNINTSSYAWGQDIGWLNWGTSEGDITVDHEKLTGYAWGENVGWISLNCSNTNSCATVDYKVSNTQEGVLSGYAWGENVGWINFRPTYGGGSINTAGQFMGYIWGENVGWISLNCANGTGSCSTVDFYVSTTWIPSTSGGNTGPGTQPPNETPAPTSAPTTSPTPTPTQSPTTTPTGNPTPTTAPTGTPFPTGTPGTTPITTPITSPPVESPTVTVPPRPPTPTSPPENISFINKITNTATNASRKVSETSDEISIASVPFVIASSLMSSANLLFSGVGILQYLRYVIGMIAVILGIKKRAKPWGTVFNSKTMQPLPFTSVQLLNKDKRVIETRVTDKDGRYGFILNPESFETDTPEVMINVNRKGFVFPSNRPQMPQGLTLYRNIYAGGLIRFTKESTVNYDIPIDPLEEGQKEARSLAGPLRMFIHNSFVKIVNIAFWISLVFVPLNYIYDRTTFNLVLLIVLFVINIFRIFGDLKEKPYGMVVDRSRMNPMPYALISVDSKEGQRKGFAVSDESGKYILITEKGQFDVSLFTPATIQPPRIQKIEVGTKKGWITKRFHL
ncbi:MAG: hypothetical protein ABH833_01190 [Parcubacteria group bacterium]